MKSFELPVQACITMLLLCVIGHSASSFAFKLQIRQEHKKAASQAKTQSGRQSILEQFGKPVHERLTELAFQCPTGARCATPFPAETELVLENIMRGVHWNDNPMFTPTGFAVAWRCKGVTLKLGWRKMTPGKYGCWAAVWERGLSATEPITSTSGEALLLRSHFGDLQFLHSMAMADETPDKTIDKIMTFAEFAYLFSQGKIEPAAYITSLPRPQRFDQIVNRPEWRANAFTDFETNRKVAAGIAFGTLLHMVQDSFAGCHTVREPPTPENSFGRISQFLSYEKQDPLKHAALDDVDVTSPEAKQAIRATQELIQLRRKNADWDNEVGPYLRVLFQTSDDPKSAGPGPQRCPAISKPGDGSTNAGSG